MYTVEGFDVSVSATFIFRTKLVFWFCIDAGNSSFLVDQTFFRMSRQIELQ